MQSELELVIIVTDILCVEWNVELCSLAALAERGTIRMCVWLLEQSSSLHSLDQRYRGNHLECDD